MDWTDSITRFFCEFVPRQKSVYWIWFWYWFVRSNAWRVILAGVVGGALSCLTSWSLWLVVKRRRPGLSVGFYLIKAGSWIVAPYLVLPAYGILPLPLIPGFPYLALPILAIFYSAFRLPVVWMKKGNRNWLIYEVANIVIEACLVGYLTELFGAALSCLGDQSFPEV